MDGCGAKVRTGELRFLYKQDGVSENGTNCCMACRWIQKCARQKPEVSSGKDRLALILK